MGLETSAPPHFYIFGVDEWVVGLTLKAGTTKAVAYSKPLDQLTKCFSSRQLRRELS